MNEGDLIDHAGSDSMGGEVPDAIYAQVREFEADISAQQLDDRVQRTLDALQSIGRRLQSVPGRKNLIWLSGSFPLDLYPDDNFMAQSVRHYGEKLAATLTVLENARVAIYPVSANGCRLILLLPLIAILAGSGEGERRRFRMRASNGGRRQPQPKTR